MPPAPPFRGAHCALAFLLASARAARAADTMEARNAAAGLVMTHAMFVDITLGHRCGALPAPDGPSARAAQRGWLDRNAEPVLVSRLWIRALGDSIAARMGEDAGAQFLEQRNAEFGDAVSCMQQTVLTNGEVTQVACARITKAVDAGSFDVAHTPGVAETLRRMGAERVPRSAD